MGMVSCFAAASPATIALLQSAPEEMEAFLYPDDGEPEHYADVDKAWHCIHFMLTGTPDSGAEPLSWVFFGGEEVGDDMGYGPARLLQPDQVRAIAMALAAVDEDNFKSRYAPSAMQAANVYLSDMCVRDGDEALDYLVCNYHSLKTFYRSAAERGDGAVLWVS